MAQETRAVLTARKLLQSKLRDIENSLRGVLRGFGLKVGNLTADPRSPGVSVELVAGHPRHLELVAKALLEAHAVLRREFQWPVTSTRRLCSRTTSVGQAVDDNAVRRSDRGSHLCLLQLMIPKQFRSSKTDRRAFQPRAKELNRGKPTTLGIHYGHRSGMKVRAAINGDSDNRKLECLR